MLGFLLLVLRKEGVGVAALIWDLCSLQLANVLVIRKTGLAPASACTCRCEFESSLSSWRNDQGTRPVTLVERVSDLTGQEGPGRPRTKYPSSAFHHCPPWSNAPVVPPADPLAADIRENVLYT